MDASTAPGQKRSLPNDTASSRSSCSKRRRRTIDEFFGESATPMVGSSSQSTLHQYMELKGPAPQVDPVILKGFKVFTAQEIQEAEGLEKDYRQFWNFKMQEICGDKKARGLNKKAIVGAVTTSWYLHKVDLMQIQVDELTCLLHAEYSCPSKLEAKMKSVNKNLKRMLVSRESIRTHYKAIEAVKSQSEKLKIEEEITTEITELKKAIEALKKAIERRLGDITKIRAKQRQEKSTRIINSELSVPEVEEIVQEIKKEEEQQYSPLCDEEDLDYKSPGHVQQQSDGESSPRSEPFTPSNEFEPSVQLQADACSPSQEKSFMLIMSDESESDTCSYIGLPGLSVYCNYSDSDMSD